VTMAFSVGVGFLLLLGPIVATPVFLVLALLPRVKDVRVEGVLAGVVAGTLIATPVISRGYALGEAVGFPFLGALGAAALVVLSAYAVGMVVEVVRRQLWSLRPPRKG
jgi:hypothetical protein